tara:strand:- start:169 stop:354 length:186 start_codon:yes stop_codon:yes gene_type:complete
LINIQVKKKVSEPPKSTLLPDQTPIAQMPRDFSAKYLAPLLTLITISGKALPDVLQNFSFC